MIADDQAAIRRGFRLIFEVQAGATLVAEAADEESALGAASETLPDVLLSGMRMPGPGFPELPRGPAPDAPSVRVVVVTTFDVDEYAHVALHDAHGFLLKYSDAALLTQAVRSAVNGDSLDSPEITTRLPKRLTPDGPVVSTPGAELTPREREVAGLVAEGLTNTDIGAALFISQGTVKTHLANLQRKLKVRNRVGVAAWVWQSGLREPSRAVK
ncbi:LuxR C-terminal-related transcriptional regulator [Streptomyces sp. NBC_00878]|uniref:response regulator transcription factor n=1 Tax=Streptomyces sp. NBC_00878 TaxID=2975854 RepID=UPI0022588F5F|nr:response regulator transcription factor [Streptomyces sp. NBC_00878]MCX4910617.1 response regulator transcription factor [Streptomyces sp. NBC_00878]